jgi:hypothetical protein
MLTGHGTFTACLLAMDTTNQRAYPGIRVQHDNAQECYTSVIRKKRGEKRDFAPESTHHTTATNGGFT